MAQRGKAISVKVATVKVIKALEDSLAKLEAAFASQEALEAKHQVALDKWKVDMGKWAVKNISRAVNLSAYYRSYNDEVQVRFDIASDGTDFPKEPKSDFETIHASTYREQKAELENAIRILKMTDEETVSTSTYQAVARYL